MTPPRDYSLLFPDGLHCAVCGQPRVVKDVHAEYHLARCEAVTDTERGVTRVIPNLPQDAAADAGVIAGARLGRRSVGARRLDPVLRKIVARELRKRRA